MSDMTKTATFYARAAEDNRPGCPLTFMGDLALAAHEVDYERYARRVGCVPGDAVCCIVDNSCAYTFTI